MKKKRIKSIIKVVVLLLFGIAGDHLAKHLGIDEYLFWVATGILMLMAVFMGVVIIKNVINKKRGFED